MHRQLTHEERLNVISGLDALRVDILAERGGVPIRVEEIDRAIWETPNQPCCENRQHLFEMWEEYVAWTDEENRDQVPSQVELCYHEGGGSIHG